MVFNGDIPEMPTIDWEKSSYRADGNILNYSGSYGIGWNIWPAEQGGPAFILARQSLLGVNKPLPERYPPTEEGWKDAWRKFEEISPKNAREARTYIANREKMIEEQRTRDDFKDETLTFLGSLLYLGGHAPGIDISVQSSYDVRFLDDRLAVFRQYSTANKHGELLYSDLVDLQIGGPGAVQSVHPLVGPAQTIAGGALRAIQPGINPNVLSAENGAVSAALKAVGTRTKIKTVLFAQSADSELFFLSTTLEPDQLRINLSPAISRIREILTEKMTAADTHQPPSSTSSASMLSDIDKAVDWLDRGLITREEFERIKSRLISGS